jgi:uncharacterized ParB-like nuclease family protein
MKIKLAFIKVPVEGYSKFTELRKTESLDTLKESINKVGLLEPVLVMKNHGDSQYPYELIAGSRRYQAALELGWDALPAVIVKAESNLAALDRALAANLHQPYSSFEEIELILYRYRLWKQKSSPVAVLLVAPESFCIETGALLRKPAEEIREILTLSGLDLDLKDKVLSGDHGFCEAWAIQTERNIRSPKKKRYEPRKQLYLQLLDIQQKAPFLTNILSAKLWLQSNAVTSINLSLLKPSSLRRLQNDTQTLIGYLSQWSVKFEKALKKA